VVENQPQSILGVPLVYQDKLVGILYLENNLTPGAFTPDRVQVLQLLSAQAAIAIQNARLYEEAQQEIAKRVEVGLSLLESEARYRTLFDGVPVGLYRTTPAGQIVDVNLAMVQMLGYPSREELLATNSANLYADLEERVRWQDLLEREGVVRFFEIRCRRCDGTLIWANDTARAVRDERGQLLYYEGSLEDITERKQTQHRLEESEEEFRTLYEATRDAVMLLDEEGFFDCTPPH
jgi:PAS domain S-box-containing protein